ncbi:hypothetical protein C6P45_000639 [Maudiozyma exigua]|uniref:FHA domain-containing protein n=1 Tax=Maudiozyma exigua TaxID=34358 RepID=A0A9P6W733_MAUEX|nr:hypothetical protein C6P45_000639 [Kazachstania exigua]
MNNMFPPSSPVTGSNALSFEERNKDSQSSNSSLYGSKPTALKFRNNPQPNNAQYPSPFPSSSIGIISSPVKVTSLYDSDSVDSPNSSFEGLPQTSSNNQFNKICAISPPQIESFTKRQKEAPKVKDDAKFKVFPRLIEIEINPMSNAQLTIGRKKDMCDVLLPGMRTISRKHALINYIPDRNQIRLQCIGINGLIISLPRKLNCYLIRPGAVKDVYELCAIETIKMRQQFQNVDTNVGKELIKGRDITAFTLEPKETIIMPFMNNTIIDFKQVKTCLSMRHQTNDYDIVSEQKIAQRSISSVAHKKISRKIETTRNPNRTTDSPNKNTVTPVSSFVEREPKTPTKKHDSLLKSSFQMSKKEPISSNLHNALTDAYLTEIQNVATNTPVPQTHKRKLGTSSHHNNGSTHKRLKPVEKSTDEIMNDLKTKDINIEDLQHILANHLAFSNVQQTPLSLLRDTNSTVKTLTKEELRLILKLEKCIGVIARTGKDAAGKPLEEEYFYDVENDDDEQRKALVASMKGGRSGLRSCRRTHKQYFWKRPAKK